MDERSLTFVYGTLQAGQRNHRRLRGARFVRAAKTSASFELIDLGEYPALVAGGDTAVLGELYEVPVEIFPALDHFEGVPDLFYRAAIELEGGVRAQAYLFAGSAEGAPRISGGSWSDHVRKRPDMLRGEG